MKIFNSKKNNIKLSILILSITERVNPYLIFLLDKLNIQIKKHPIELVVLLDNQKNTIGNKRNQLLENAQGKYICFIDDDDDIADTYVEKIIKALKKNPDCVVFDSWVTLKKKKTKNNVKGKLCKFGIEYENKNLNEEYHRLPNHLMVIKKSLLIDIRFLDTNFGEDTDWSEKIKPRIIKQERIDEILYYYNYDHKISRSGTY